MCIFIQRASDAVPSLHGPLVTAQCFLAIKAIKLKRKGRTSDGIILGLLGLWHSETCLPTAVQGHSCDCTAQPLVLINHGRRSSRKLPIALRDVECPTSRTSQRRRRLRLATQSLSPPPLIAAFALVLQGFSAESFREQGLPPICTAV